MQDFLPKIEFRPWNNENAFPLILRADEESFTRNRALNFHDTTGLMIIGSMGGNYRRQIVHKPNALKFCVYEN